MIRSIDLPQLDDKQVRRINRLLACNGMTFDVRGTSYSLSFSGSPTMDQVDHRLQIMVGERGFCAELDRLPFVESIEALLGDVDLQALPEELALAFLTEVCARPLVRLGAHLGTVVRLNELSRDGQTNPDTTLQSVYFRLSGPKYPVNGRLLLSASDWPTLLEALPDTDKSADLSWGHLPIPINWLVGWTHLTAHQARELTAGDLVILDTSFAEDKLGICLPGMGVWQARREQGLILEERMALTQPQSSDALDNPQLQIIFEVGRGEISLKELANLEPGSVIETEAEIEAGVRIRVNGVDAGRGELVALGDRFAVRILELFRQREPLAEVS